MQGREDHEQQVQGKLVVLLRCEHLHLLFCPALSCRLEPCAPHHTHCALKYASAGCAVCRSMSCPVLSCHSIGCIWGSRLLMLCFWWLCRVAAAWPRVCFMSTIFSMALFVHVPCGCSMAQCGVPYAGGTGKSQCPSSSSSSGDLRLAAAFPHFPFLTEWRAGSRCSLSSCYYQYLTDWFILLGPS